MSSIPLTPAQTRAELETGLTEWEWAVGLVLCPAREKCTERIDQLFVPLKNGRLPMHRGLFNIPCVGAHKKPLTAPLQLRQTADGPPGRPAAQFGPDEGVYGRDPFYADAPAVPAP
jgi:hypothetical protein